jgi:hypothetical protein
MADERLDDTARERRRGLLAAGDHKGHVRDAWTHRRLCVRSTGSATPTSLSSGSKSSLPPSTTGSTPQRSVCSDACSPGGLLRSPRGTDHAPATQRPRGGINGLDRARTASCFGSYGSPVHRWRWRLSIASGPSWRARRPRSENSASRRAALGRPPVRAKPATAPAVRQVLKGLKPPVGSGPMGA